LGALACVVVKYVYQKVIGSRVTFSILIK